MPIQHPETLHYALRDPEGPSSPVSRDQTNIAVIPQSHPYCVRDPLGKADWRREIIYFLMTDRFHKGGVTALPKIDCNDLYRFQGGDVAGIIEKLEYLASLNISAIWLTPLMKNQPEFFGSEGYHGYWPIDFRSCDEHFGNMQVVKELVGKATSLGLRIILDIPLNHVAWEHPWTKDPAKRDWFHDFGPLREGAEGEELELACLHGLPDLAQENPEVADELISVCKWWIEETGASGLRLDAVKHVPRAFWKRVEREVIEFAGPDFLLLGEYYDGDPGKLVPHQQDGMLSLLDFPLFFTSQAVFKHDHSMRDLARCVAYTNSLYPHPELMGGFLDNHDTDRFATGAEENPLILDKLRLALTFLLTTNRVPVVYYGTEVGMEGRQEKYPEWGPENRQTMRWGKNEGLTEYFRRMARIRLSEDALCYGVNLEMWQDDLVYAYVRKHEQEELIVILNNGYEASTRRMPLRGESCLTDGTVLVDLITLDSHCIIEHGWVEVTCPAKGAVILKAQTRS